MIMLIPYITSAYIAMISKFTIVSALFYPVLVFASLSTPNVGGIIPLNPTGRLASFPEISSKNIIQLNDYTHKQ